MSRAKILIAAAGGCVALLCAAPAQADPLPAPAVPNPVVPAPVLPGPVNPDAAIPGPALLAAPASTDGTPHLPSPEALPTGTTMDPALAGRDPSPNTSYLRDLWQAVQSQEISGKEALILGLSQRGMNTPIPAQAPGPNVPIQYPRDAALPPAAPAPVPVP